MQASLDLSIIVVNWNSAEFVRQCVNSIRKNLSGLTYEIIVVDNASFDGCDRVLREHDQEVIFLQAEKNLGFARANNLASATSRGNTLLFLNPDTEIIGDAVFRLHEILHQLPKAGAVGAKLLNSDRTLQASCIQSFPTIVNQVLDSEWLRKRCPKSELWGMSPLYQMPAVPDEIQGISGAYLMIRREVFERIGRFSEDYFMYTEDLDLCYKVIKSGWKNYYVPDAVIVHFGGGSSKQAASNFSSVMMRESIWRFLRKTRGDFYGLGYRSSMLLAAVGRLGLLAILFPVQKFRSRQQRWMISFKEWSAVLRWSVGCETWSRSLGRGERPNK
jgi:N-acetylglucosaminyl-diphospho-decaprenol L-rhamnosyltransferase